MDYFFYGTLMDTDVLSLVIDRRVPARLLVPATLRGYKRVTVKREVYPVIIEAPEGQVDGVWFRGANATEARLLGYYEGPLYTVAEVTCETLDRGPVKAWTFVPKRADLAGDEPWTLDQWTRKHKRRYLAGLSQGGGSGR